MTTALTIKTRHETDYTIVTVAGPIDITTVAGLRERLFELAVTGQPLVADLDQVGFIDSTGLGVLVGTAKRAASAGGMLQVVSAQSNIRKLFRITGLDSEIPLAHTLEEAQQALAARAAPERQ
jgi:anti-sigma B factor antagonist